MAILSDNDCKRIEQTIGELEKHTAGEVVVAEVSRSARHDRMRALFTVTLTIVAGFALYEWLPRAAPTWIFVAQLPMAYVLWVASGWGPLHRALIPPGEAQDAVHARALQMFLERGIYETRDRSGVLILISELEHRVEILADQGVHERVGEISWAGYASRIVNAIRMGQTAEGIILVLNELGEVLCRDFPIRPDDVNELPDAVVRER